ncbi:uncharacterized protein JCM15063_005019 [Sporobolomyces koalae]|uniref:uncharacterized protein n=1 Tax=Sporobolomyces koalae TaxID=500713 RepID=UPI003174383D
MSTLSTTPSISTCDKKIEGGFGCGCAIPVAQSSLPIIDERDADEGAQLAGELAQAFTQYEQDAVRRKLDRRVVPILAAVYFSQFLDKNSLNYAAVMQLPLTGEKYNLVVLAFYLGYLVFEIPQSILAQRFPLAKYLGWNIILWAAALTLHSASGKFAPFFVFRVLLGVFESVVSPVLIALVASFYAKNEQSKRIGAFYAMNGVTNIVGGLIAYGITFYQGDAVAHWRIIYFVLGGLAFAVGILVISSLADSPTTARFLSEREKRIALERVRANQSGTISHRWKKAQAIEALTDFKLWWLLFLMACISVPNSCITSFTSILIKSFGYTSQEALLFNIPSGVVAIITTLSISYWADKKGVRMLPFAASIVPSIVGLGLLVGFSQGGATGAHKGPLIVGILLAQTFVSGIAMLYSFSAANFAGSSKRSIVNALLLVAFSLGNLAGTQVFQAKDKPQYLPGKISLLVLLLVLFPSSLVMHIYIRRKNAAKAEEVARLVAEHGWTDDELQKEKDRYAFLDLTDKQNPFYVYTA